LKNLLRQQAGPGLVEPGKDTSPLACHAWWLTLAELRRQQHFAEGAAETGASGGATEAVVDKSHAGAGLGLGTASGVGVAPAEPKAHADLERQVIDRQGVEIAALRQQLLASQLDAREQLDTLGRQLETAVNEVCYPYTGLQRRH